jgi:hypothetical protein
MIMDRQSDLFEDNKTKDNIGNDSLETIIQKTDSESIKKIKTADNDDNQKDITQKIAGKNVYENYGITESAINMLPYSVVRSIFYGINNFNCPELYQYMNPAEILGLWAGINRKTGAFQSKMKANSLTDTISQLVSTGYSLSIYARDKKIKEHNLSYISKKTNEKANVYTTAPGDMKKRLDDIDAETKQKIIDGLNAPLRYTEDERKYYSTRPNFDGNNLIYDPDCDARDAGNKKAYSSIIMNIIKSTSKRNFYK